MRWFINKPKKERKFSKFCTKVLYIYLRWPSSVYNSFNWQRILQRYIYCFVLIKTTINTIKGLSKLTLRTKITKTNSGQCQWRAFQKTINPPLSLSISSFCFTSFICLFANDLQATQAHLHFYNTSKLKNKKRNKQNSQLYSCL